jgi:hypothetical protein
MTDHDVLDTPVCKRALTMGFVTPPHAPPADHSDCLLRRVPRTRKRTSDSCYASVSELDLPRLKFDDSSDAVFEDPVPATSYPLFFRSCSTVEDLQRVYERRVCKLWSSDVLFIPRHWQFACEYQSRSLSLVSRGRRLTLRIQAPELFANGFSCEPFIRWSLTPDVIRRPLLYSRFINSNGFDRVWACIHYLCENTFFSKKLRNNVGQLFVASVKCDAARHYMCLDCSSSERVLLVMLCMSVLSPRFVRSVMRALHRSVCDTCSLHVRVSN